MKKQKWQCEECYEEFKLKRDLVEHLLEDFDEFSQMADVVSNQLEEMEILPNE